MHKLCPFSVNRLTEAHPYSNMQLGFLHCVFYSPAFSANSEKKSRNHYRLCETCVVPIFLLNFYFFTVRVVPIFLLNFYFFTVRVVPIFLLKSCLYFFFTVPKNIDNGEMSVGFS